MLTKCLPSVYLIRDKLRTQGLQKQQFQQNVDHIILFDENAIQMAVDFELKELGKMIENDLKQKQAVEKQPVNEDSEVDEFKGGLMGKL
ncbi:Conserved_hypothetical protein [Hexamita inflata]|uniref:Uncharacterized protein n=1 Tax=Hexamita inflata TaxID=28002 RepID=A0AA86TT20_9EUKA|nr:Conserved hypothetical protein [Hexamita inflata]